MELKLNQQHYTELKHDLLSTFLTNLSEADLRSILNEFRNSVKSSRALSHIRNLEDLVKVLEARSILSPGYVTPLERIAELANRPNALKRVHDYIGSTTVATLSLPQLPPQSSVAPTLAQSKNNLNKVCSIICDNVGRDWRNLARNLGCVNEREIQDIEKRMSLDSARAQEVFLIFQQKNQNDEQQCIELIIQALKGIPRYPIIRMIEKELPSHYRVT